jgi:CheY-like chemotaxis protein
MAVNASGTKKVLYVEDYQVNLDLVQAILDTRPHVQLLTAAQGSVGLELARQHVPDLILLDLHLPDMTGEECLRQMRGIAAIADIPVVIISADATSEQCRHFLKLGVADYLTKPFDVSHFEEVVDRYLGNAK